MLGYGGSVVGWQRGLLHTDSLLNIDYIISMTKIVTIEQCYFHRHVITIIIYEHSYYMLMAISNIDYQDWAKFTHLVS